MISVVILVNMTDSMKQTCCKTLNRTLLSGVQKDVALVSYLPTEECSNDNLPAYRGM